MKKLSALIPIAIAVGTFSTATAAAAIPAGIWAHVYGESALRGSCYADPGYGAVYDRNHESVGVYGRFRLGNGNIVDISDANGASGGGTYETPQGQHITAVECVWRRGTSSGWHQV